MHWMGHAWVRAPVSLASISASIIDFHQGVHQGFRQGLRGAVAAVPLAPRANHPYGPHPPLSAAVGCAQQ